MKALVNTAPSKLELLDVPLPQPSRGQVRIRTGACGICATDLEMIKGWDRTGFPSIPGHEWSGMVDAVGEDVDPAWVGRRCVAENVLADGGEIGFEHPGGYGEYLLTEAANLYALPDDFPFPSAVLIEPLAVALRGIRRLRLEDRSAALIVGDGPIGLLSLMLLRRAGVEEIVLAGGRAARLKVAGELGAAKIINYHQAGESLREVLLEGRQGGFPNVIEASGSARAMETCLGAAAKGGHILVLGDYGMARADFRWNHLLWGEWEIIGSNASAGAWAEAVQLAAGGEIDLGRLVTRVYPLAEWQGAFDLVRDRQAGAIKVVLSWE